MRMPKLITAHLGCGAPQSAHLALLLAAIMANGEVTLRVRVESGRLRRLWALLSGAEVPARRSPDWIDMDAGTLSELEVISELDSRSRAAIVAEEDGRSILVMASCWWVDLRGEE